MPYKYIGKTTDFKGKSLWEILGNLKNFGKGRIVVRSRFERYPEPSYLKILEVDTFAEPENPSMDVRRLVKVTVERTFRGETIPRPVFINATSYKADYRLIPKDEEADYCKSKALRSYPKHIMPKTTDFPPLLKELIVRASKLKGKPIEDPKLEIVYNEKGLRTKYKIAEEGEIPTINVPSGLGTPISPSLYENIKI